MENNIKLTQQTVTGTRTQALESVPLNHHLNYAIQVVATVNTPSAATFTANAATDIITVTTHGASNGLKVQVSSTTTLPAGLSAVTDYFVYVVSPDTIKLATSLANLDAGTFVNITDAGTGVHTITPTAIAGCAIKLQESVDNSVWYDISGSSTNITATANTLLQGTSKCAHIRVYLTQTAGQVTLANTITSKI